MVTWHHKRRSTRQCRHLDHHFSWSLPRHAPEGAAVHNGRRGIIDRLQSRRVCFVSRAALGRVYDFSRKTGPAAIRAEHLQGSHASRLPSSKPLSLVSPDNSVCLLLSPAPALALVLAAFSSRLLLLASGFFPFIPTVVCLVPFQR